GCSVCRRRCAATATTTVRSARAAPWCLIVETREELEITAQVRAAARRRPDPVAAAPSPAGQGACHSRRSYRISGFRPGWIAAERVPDRDWSRGGRRWQASDDGVPHSATMTPCRVDTPTTAKTSHPP